MSLQSVNPPNLRHRHSRALTDEIGKSEVLRKIWFAHLYSNKLSFECPAERYLSSIKLEKEGDIAATLLAFFTNGLRHAYVNKLTFAGVDFTVVCDVISALESSQEVVILEFDSIDFRDDAASAFHDAVFSVPYLIYLTICDCRTPHSFITDKGLTDVTVHEKPCDAEFFAVTEEGIFAFLSGPKPRDAHFFDDVGDGVVLILSGDDPEDRSKNLSLQGVRLERDFVIRLIELEKENKASNYSTMGSYSLYLSPFISDNLNMDEYADRVEEFYSSDLFRHRVYDVAYRIIDPPIGFDHEEGKKSLEIENAPGFSGDPDSDWSDYSDCVLLNRRVQ
ncbi:hypothetical protein AAVH_14079 [Aphelenchoides avenae]|nr:hypothetical protein AAVH_14079 [Aphelenchus avenae]